MENEQEINNHDLDENNMYKKKVIDEDLKRILIENELQSYIETLEKEKLYTISDLETLSQDDYKELGILALGDRKKFLRLFSVYDSLGETNNLPAINGIPQYPMEDNMKSGYETDDYKPESLIINNNIGSESDGAHTGLAGVLGGILGAAAVIIFGLIILSNESWAL